ncbi:hypothetical protein JY97_14670 [Alkalispirochaeta odontotermitis]|nr:hypothetical protein JY97_14670 [Alkalispirochaeta odontotermitis]CAB1084630.1 hypothetical protein D1AOALGA4SA_12143 [Olavius algarvensis Delta 1 endosymbiont]
MRPISLTALRSNLFKIVDSVIETGNPVELERKGHRLKIVIEGKKSKLENLKPHDCIVGNPDELIDLKVAEWHEIEKL